MTLSSLVVLLAPSSRERHPMEADRITLLYTSLQRQVKETEGLLADLKAKLIAVDAVRKLLFEQENAAKQAATVKVPQVKGMQQHVLDAIQKHANKDGITAREVTRLLQESGSVTAAANISKSVHVALMRLEVKGWIRAEKTSDGRRFFNLQGMKSPDNVSMIMPARQQPSGH
ncbi:MAG: hypothetical protein H7X91_11655 [Burkholderiales bacterium]|nr:hypothetical protein [Burkholderiales bacterium]